MLTYLLSGLYSLYLGQSPFGAAFALVPILSPYLSLLMKLENKFTYDLSFLLDQSMWQGVNWINRNFIFKLRIYNKIYIELSLFGISYS